MIHNNEIVSIEEVLIKPELAFPRYHTRHFIFTNRSTHLKVRIASLDASIRSCQIANREIVFHHESNGTSNHDQRVSEQLLQWESHVFGFDTVELSYLTVKNITYQLTKSNELLIEGKDAPNVLLQPSSCLMSPVFFNLNLVDDKPTLAGHCLCIHASNEAFNVLPDQPNSETNNICAQFIRNVPLSISDYLEGSEFIYSANNETIIPDSYIVASLNYEERRLDVLLEIGELRIARLRVMIKNGSIAFIPHNMNGFKLTYKFHI